MEQLREIPSKNLWVDNLASDIIDADLMSRFHKYGPLDSVTLYSSHGLGFLCFKNINDAKEAKDALHGSFFHGFPLNIKFANLDQESEFREIMRNRSIGCSDPRLMPQAFVRSNSDPRQHEQGSEFWKMENRSIDCPVPHLMSQAFVRSYSDPRQHEQGSEFQEQGQYPNRSIGHPDPRLMPQEFVENCFDASFPRQHLRVGQRAHEQPSDVLCIRYPPSVHVDGHGLCNAMIQLGEINRIRRYYDSNFSLVEFRSVEEAQRTKESLQGKLFNDPRITIEYSSNGLAVGGNFMEYHPPIIDPTTDYSPNENSFQPAQIDMFDHNPDDYKWRGIITKCGEFICHARCSDTLFGQRMETVFPDIVNCSHKMGLDKLAEYYADVAVGFSIFPFLPDGESDFASYTEFMKYLISNYRAWVAEFDGTVLFLVPPSDFLRKTLKVDGPRRIYGVILKYGPQYVGQAARPLFTPEVIAGASASDVSNLLL